LFGVNVLSISNQPVNNRLWLFVAGKVSAYIHFDNKLTSSEGVIIVKTTILLSKPRILLAIESMFLRAELKLYTLRVNFKLMPKINITNKSNGHEHNYNLRAGRSAHAKNRFILELQKLKSRK